MSKMYPTQSRGEFSDKSDSDMSEKDSEFGDRYAGVKLDEMNAFSQFDIWGKLNEMCGKRPEKKTMF